LSASTWAKSVFRVKSNVNGEFTRRTVTVFLACRVFCGAAGALAKPVVKHRVSNVKKPRHCPLTLFDTLFILSVFQRHSLTDVGSDPMGDTS